MNKKICALVGVLLLAVGAIVLRLHAPRPLEIQSADVPRGQLLDYRGTPLTAAEVRWQPAVSIPELRRYPQGSISRFVDSLAKELGLDPQVLYGLRTEDTQNVHERHVPARMTTSQMDELKTWLGASEWRNTPQLIRFIQVPGRMYPQRELAANLIGFVNKDGVGQEGMESELEELLQTGSDARLSIDIDMQRLLAARMQGAMDALAMREANAVVVDLASQRIASIVSLPSFDPARIEERSGSNVRLRPATAVFQAGPMLEPFYLSELLGSDHDEAADLRARFVRGESGVGVRMVDVLGYDDARASLQYAQLLEPLDIDFPGVTGTLERRAGTPAELLRDLGNGAGIAPNLLRYSISLAGLITGRPLPSPRILMASSAQMSYALMPDRAAGAQSLRAAMVERARQQGAGRTADFGGMWVSYRDRIDKGEPIHRAAIILFAPAAQPRYLLTITFVTSKITAGHDLLDVGHHVVSDLMFLPARDEQPKTTLGA